MSEIEDLEKSITIDMAYVEHRKKELHEAYRYAENSTAQRRNELIAKNAMALSSLEEDNRRTIRSAIHSNKRGMQELREIELEISEKRAILEKLKGENSEK